MKKNLFYTKNGCLTNDKVPRQDTRRWREGFSYFLKGVRRKRAVPLRIWTWFIWSISLWRLTLHHWAVIFSFPLFFCHFVTLSIFFSFSLPPSLSLCFSLSLSLSVSVSRSVSLSVSLSIYIYVCMYPCWRNVAVLFMEC